MQAWTRTTVALAALALVTVGCGGTGDVTVDPVSEPPSTGDDDVLSSCVPVSGDQQTTTLVEADDGARPSVEDMEAALADNPDAQFIIEDLESEGTSRDDALHQMYGQVVGQELFAAVEDMPGFVTGAFARPLEGEPFELSFSGEVPDELDLDAFDLASYGLVVTTGASGFDHDAFAAAFEAAGEAGIETVGGSGDETTGTGTIEVIDATPDEVAAWEDAVDDPSRWCMVRAPRTVDCDDDVVADARDRAERQGEVLSNEQTGEEQPTAERADEVRRSYLGLTLEAAEAKAAEEGRGVRVTVKDGVQLGQTDDLQPGRVSLTLCQDVVVDTVMDAEPGR